MLTLSGTPHFSQFKEFIISAIHYIYIICQSNDYVCGLMTGLFAWISPTALSWDLFYYTITVACVIE